MTNLQKTASRFAASAARRFADARYATATAASANIRNLAIVAVGWLLARGATWKAAARVLFVSAILGVAGYAAGYAGFGSFTFIDDRDTVAFWHSWLAPMCAVFAPALGYTFRRVAGFFEARGLNAFALGLCAFPFYLAVVAVTFVVFGLWTFPFYVAGQVAKIALAILTPLLHRALNRLAAEANVDVAAKIVRDMARTIR